MLMRHAKSDWNSHTTDIDRPLNDRGRKDAIRMGVYLKRVNIFPDRMVVSPAQRTRETAGLLLNNLPLADNDIVFDKELYLADQQTLCDIIELYITASQQSRQRILILAHNPGMDYLVSYLASAPLPLTDSGKLMTTCALACFHMDSPEDLRKPGRGKLLNLIRPKEIMGN